jgi:hypothetical protein
MERSPAPGIILDHKQEQEYSDQAGPDISGTEYTVWKEISGDICQGIDHGNQKNEIQITVIGKKPAHLFFALLI